KGVAQSGDGTVDRVHSRARFVHLVQDLRQLHPKQINFVTERPPVRIVSKRFVVVEQRARNGLAATPMLEAGMGNALEIPAAVPDAAAIVHDSPIRARASAKIVAGYLLFWGLAKEARGPRAGCYTSPSHMACLMMATCAHASRTSADSARPAGVCV